MGLMHILERKELLSGHFFIRRGAKSVSNFICLEVRMKCSLNGDKNTKKSKIIQETL